MDIERADLALVRRGLARSRAAASELIRSGLVAVDGKPVLKPSSPVLLQSVITITSRSCDFAQDDGGVCARDDELSITPTISGQGGQSGKGRSSEAMVSRAGGKLAGAIADLQRQGFAVEIEGKNCLDIGASTGGFTQVILENGASRVIALDVGHGQLRSELRENAKVIVLERVNARYLTPDQLPFPPEFITCDVSFISLTMMFPAVKRVAKPGAQVLLLVKPQFEVGRGNLGKGGVVRDDRLISKSLAEVEISADKNGIQIFKVIPSRVVGANGNQEFFLFGEV